MRRLLALALTTAAVVVGSAGAASAAPSDEAFTVYKIKPGGKWVRS